MHPNYNRPTSARISVEALVGLSVAALALLLFGMIFVTRGEADEYGIVDGRAARSRPHEAVEFSAPLESSRSSNSQSPGVADADRAEFDGQRPPLQQSENGMTVTSDGVTVLTPPLLVPVVNLAEHLDLTTSTNEHVRNSTVKRHRRSTAQTHYVRRHKETRIVVGLAANRRFVAER